MAKAAGADITEAESKCDADTPYKMKAPRTLPAIVAKPPVITAWISDIVKFGKNGRISNGASVYNEDLDNIRLLKR